MQIDGETLVMCRLVAFAEKEIEYALENKLNVEGYAQEVLKRFQVLYPDAVLILGDFKVGSDEWHKSLTKPHVHCWVNGTWEFYSSCDSMSVEVKTDGTIHLDEGTAEGIFNYVND